MYFKFIRLNNRNPKQRNAFLVGYSSATEGMLQNDAKIVCTKKVLNYALLM